MVALQTHLFQAPRFSASLLLVVHAGTFIIIILFYLFAYV